MVDIICPVWTINVPEQPKVLEKRKAAGSFGIDPAALKFLKNILFFFFNAFCCGDVGKAFAHNVGNIMNDHKGIGV